MAYGLHRLRQAGGDLRIVAPTQPVKQRLAVAALESPFLRWRGVMAFSAARVVFMLLMLLGLGSMTSAQVLAADPNWVYVEVGVGMGMTVSTDGTYCQYPTNFPIKAGTEVQLRTESSDEPVVAALNSLIAETYNEDEKSPGDGCAIWAKFDDVEMSDGYLVEIVSAETTSAPYTEDMAVVLNFWTSDFTTSFAPDGGQACEPEAPTAMRPGGSFQTEPAGEPFVDPPIRGAVSGTACRVTLVVIIPGSGDVAVAIGDTQLASHAS